MSDPLIRLLDALPSAQPDPTRSERIRRRCHARLARHAPPTPASPVSRADTARVWQPLIGLLGIAYLTEVIVQVVRLRVP
jgi:hypothetical protein